MGLHLFVEQQQVQQGQQDINDNQPHEKAMTPIG
jgi:hypothetical protein